MGLVQSCFHRALKRNSQEGEEKEESKQYSWDQKKDKDVSKFIIENLSGEEVGRLPGEINGEQFMIRNCSDCSIYLFDHINTITIDDCKNCKIFVGPTKCSLFLRDCSSCVLVAACGQFRTRDCVDVNVFLCCATQPIIEATTKAKFGCFQYNYPELESQFVHAGLSPFNNLWWNLHDFTPVPGENNWKLLGECYKVHDFLSNPTKNEALKGLKVCSDAESSFVPATVGTRRRDHDETSLVLIFWDEKQSTRAKMVLSELKKYSEIELIKTRNIQLQSADAERIFDTKEYRAVSERGPLIALQFGGPDCLRVCQLTSRAVVEATLGQEKIYSSRDLDAAARDITNLFSFADMQLGL